MKWRSFKVNLVPSVSAVFGADGQSSAQSFYLANATAACDRRRVTPVGISVLMGYGLQVHRNEFLAMLGAFHDVICRFLASNRVNELFNCDADELRVTPAPIRRALERRLF